VTDDTFLTFVRYHNEITSHLETFTTLSCETAELFHITYIL